MIINMSHLIILSKIMVFFWVEGTFDLLHMEDRLGYYIAGSFHLALHSQFRRKNHFRRNGRESEYLQRKIPNSPTMMTIWSYLQKKKFYLEKKGA